MKNRCIVCPCLCKQLDAQEQPVCYHFKDLTAKEILAVTEKMLCWHRYFGLTVEEYAQSPTGNQFVLLLQPTDDCVTQFPDELPIMLIAETFDTVQLFFRYQVPEEICDKNPSVMFELTRQMNELLQELQHLDTNIFKKVIVAFLNPGHTSVPSA